MFQFCWQWSHYVYLVNTIKNQNCLLYVRCFITMVVQQKRSAGNHWFAHCITMVTKHATNGKLLTFYLCLKKEHFETIVNKIEAFLTYLTPVQIKTKLTLDIFSPITTKRYVVDRSNCTFSESLYHRESNGFWKHWSKFLIWPLQASETYIICDPQASLTECDLAAIWNFDPWLHTNIINHQTFCIFSAE